MRERQGQYPDSYEYSKGNSVIAKSFMRALDHRAQSNAIANLCSSICEVSEREGERALVRMLARSGMCEMRLRESKRGWGRGGEH